MSQSVSCVLQNLSQSQTNQGHCASCQKKWGLAATDTCPCGKRQTMSHIVSSCPQTKLEGGCSYCTQLMMLPGKTWREVVREDCQARKLNEEDAMDRCKWRKMIKEARWSGWVWVGESSFWYRPTRVVLDQRPLNGRCCCCCWWCCHWMAEDIWLVNALNNNNHCIVYHVIWDFF